jgi:hypothetical protein
MSDRAAEGGWLLAGGVRGSCMLALMVMVPLAAAPVLVQVDLEEAVRLPDGGVGPSSAFVLALRVPAEWVAEGALSDAGRARVLEAHLGHRDAAVAPRVVTSFASKVVAAPPGRGVSAWYEVGPDGTLTQVGPRFGPPAKSMPVAATDGAFDPGPMLDDARALLTWLRSHPGVLRVPAVFTRGPLGFSRRGRLGALDVEFDDSRLGIALADRAAHSAGGEPTCELWVVGAWTSPDERGLRFIVSRVEGPVMSGAVRQVFVQRK